MPMMATICCCCSEVIVKRGGECVREALRILNHFVQRLVALLNQTVVLLDLTIFGLNIELDSLFLTLKLHDLLIELGDLHALLHHFLVYFVSAIAQLLHFTFQLVEIIVVCHCD